MKALAHVKVRLETTEELKTKRRQIAGRKRQRSALDLCERVLRATQQSASIVEQELSALKLSRKEVRPIVGRLLLGVLAPWGAEVLRLQLAQLERIGHAEGESSKSMRLQDEYYQSILNMIIASAYKA